VIGEIHKEGFVFCFLLLFNNPPFSSGSPKIGCIAFVEFVDNIGTILPYTRGFSIKPLFWIMFMSVYVLHISKIVVKPSIQRVIWPFIASFFPSVASLKPPGPCY